MQVNQRLWLVIIAVITVALGCIQLSLSLPKTTGQWQPLESSIYYQATPDATPSRVEYFIVNGAKLPADTNFLIDEPDLLDFLSDYYQLLKNVGALTTALQQGTLIVQTADAAITLLPQQRNLSELPFLFWLQWFCGVLALLLTLLIWATRPATLVIRLFVLTGIGYAASILAASVYSTRELFIAAELWRALSLTNHAGALLFIAAMPSLLWVYPLRLPAWRWLIAFFFAAAALSLTAGLLHWFDRFSLILHNWTLLLFAGGFIGALWQWKLTRYKPKERAVLLWLQLSALLGMVFFTSLTLIPVAMNEPPLAKQG